MKQAIINADCPDCGNPEFSTPTITIEADVSKNIVRQDAVTEAKSYKGYWATHSFTKGNARNVETTNNVIFTRNVLDSKNFYFYQVAPVDANGNKFYSNTVYSRPYATERNAITPTTNNDSDLLVYYAFKGNFNDT